MGTQKPKEGYDKPFTLMVHQMTLDLIKRNPRVDLTSMFEDGVDALCTAAEYERKHRGKVFDFEAAYPDLDPEDEPFVTFHITVDLDAFDTMTDLGQESGIDWNVIFADAIRMVRARYVPAKVRRKRAYGEFMARRHPQLVDEVPKEN